MRTILFLIRKEFKQIFRNKGLLPIIFAMPLIQLLILSNAATFDIENINFAIIDYDNSVKSRELTNKLIGNKLYTFVDQVTNEDDAIHLLEQDEADLIIVFEKDFEKHLVGASNSNIQLLIDAVDGSTAGIIMSYTSFILTDYMKGLKPEINMINRSGQGVNLIERNWFNPYLNYKWFMIPGILVFLITMIGLFVNSMNIAREKEIGTIEQLNVTPLKKHHFIAGKLIPLWIIGMFEMLFGLAIAHFVFSVPVLGNLLTIFIFSGIYLITMLSIGLIISSNSNTQQQAMFVAYFLMMIFIFLSGLFTPIASMPNWAQMITKFVPISYFIDSMRNIMLKGSGLLDQIYNLVILVIFAISTFTVSILQYRKVS